MSFFKKRYTEIDSYSSISFVLTAIEKRHFFESDSDIIDETSIYFADFVISCYMESIQKLEYRWTKCIDLKENCNEK